MDRKCEHEIFNDNGLEVCCKCGEIVGAYFDHKYSISYFWCEMLNVKIYSHNIKFKKLLSRLLMTSSLSPTHVIIYVKSKLPKSLIQVRGILRKSPFKTKYYEYMFFCCCYLLCYSFRSLEDQYLKTIYA